MIRERQLRTSQAFPNKSSVLVRLSRSSDVSDMAREFESASRTESQHYGRVHSSRVGVCEHTGSAAFGQENGSQLYLLSVVRCRGTAKYVLQACAVKKTPVRCVAYLAR